MQAPHTINAYELTRLVRNPQAPRTPTGRIILDKVRLGNIGGSAKVDLAKLDLDMSQCDFRGTLLSLDNLKQLKQLQKRDFVPMHENKIDIRGATIDCNQKMLKNTATLHFDDSFSFELSPSVNNLRNRLGLPPIAPVAAAPNIPPVLAPAAAPPPPPAAPKTMNPRPTEIDDERKDARKRVRRGG